MSTETQSTHYETPTTIPAGTGAERLRNPIEFRHQESFRRLGQFLPVVEEYCAEKSVHLAKTSVNEIRSNLRTFLYYLQNVRTLDLAPTQVTCQLAYEYQDWNASRGLSDRSVVGHSMNLRAFYRWFEAEKSTARTGIGSIKTPKRRKKLPRPMSQKEILALFAVIDPNDLLQLRDLAIFELLYGSGMRIGDALNLKSRDLFLDHEELGPHVRAVCKGNIECVIPLAQASLPVLKLYRLMHQPTGEKLFHNRNSPAEGIKNASSIGVRWRHYLRRANLPNKYTMHMLRHSAATHLYANGMAIEKIQLILGHSSLRPTQLYTLVTPKQLFSAHLKADIRGLVEQHMRTSK